MKRGQIPKQGTYRSRKGKHFLISNPTKVNMSRLILSLIVYSHLSNNRGGWNKPGEEAKVAKSLNVEAGINVEVGKYL